MINLKEYILERMGDSISSSSELFKRLIKTLNKNIEVEIKDDYTIILKIDMSLVDLKTGTIKTKEGKEIDTLINFLNYYFVRIEDQNTKYVKLKYEGVKPKKIEYDHRYLYHCTNTLHIDSILKNGLCPKDATSLANHGYRIYFWGENTDRKTAEMYASIFIRSKRTDSPQNRYNHLDSHKDIVVIRIDLDALKKDNINIPIYGDPSTDGETAMFTTENIPGKYISVDKEWLKQKN